MGESGIRKYVVKIVSSGMVCIPVFIKIGLGVQKLLEVIHGDTKPRANTDRKAIS
jgi:hypothetical protein